MLITLLKKGAASVALVLATVTGFFHHQTPPPASGLAGAGSPSPTPEPVVEESISAQDITDILSSIAHSTASTPFITAATSPPTSTPPAPGTTVVKKKTVASSTITIKSPLPTPVPKVAPQISQPNLATTAQWLLDHATTSLKQKIDGSYALTFITKTGAAGDLRWGLTDSTIGDSGSVPRFSASVSCAPLPNFPLPDFYDQTPLFDVRTHYTCTVALTPTTGADKRTQSKEFSFTTGVGALTVTTKPNTKTMLNEDSVRGGVVFANTDSKPITITGLTFDVSFTSLLVLPGPLVLRFLDPGTEAPMFEYYLEDLPKDATIPSTQSEKDTKFTVALTVGPHTQKMLPLSVVGVRRIFVANNHPTVSLKVKSVATDRNDIVTILHDESILWTCTVPAQGYDPNSTSSLFATGEACRN